VCSEQGRLRREHAAEWADGLVLLDAAWLEPSGEG
jgi:hypothetical protein